MTNEIQTDAASQEWQRTVEIARRLARVVPSVRYAGSRLDNYTPATKKQADALAKAQEFTRDCPWVRDDRESNFLLMGPPGVGKTHLEVAVLYAAIADDVASDDVREHAFISYFELLRQWRAASAKRGDAEDKFFANYAGVNLLVLDDVKAPRSADEAEAIDWLIELRYRQLCRPVVLSTNLNITDLRAALGERSFDRLREAARLAVLDGASYRARFGWDGPPVAQEGAGE